MLGYIWCLENMMMLCCLIERPVRTGGGVGAGWYRGGTPILGNGREVLRWWPSFLRFFIWLGALFSILKPLKQPGSIWLTPHCADIQSNWPPFSQFPIQLTPFFEPCQILLGPFFKLVLSLPTKNFAEYPAPPPLNISLSVNVMFLVDLRSGTEWVIARHHVTYGGIPAVHKEELTGDHTITFHAVVVFCHD